MDNYQYITKDTHIDLIQPGDTILHEGELKTVTESNIGRGAFMGTTIFGDSYHLGYQPVKLVTFITLEGI